MSGSIRVPHRAPSRTMSGTAGVTLIKGARTTLTVTVTDPVSLFVAEETA